MQCPRCGGTLPQEGGACPTCGGVFERSLQQAATGPADGPAQIDFPDVCETPTDTPPGVPIPYPNIDRSSVNGPSRVKVDGEAAMVKGDTYTPTEGDEPGTGGPGGATGMLPGGANPLMVAGIVIVLVVVVATVYLLAGDGDDGPNGPGPVEGLLIDPVETSVVSVWEPTPGFHLAVVIKNNATGESSLDGHDLLVTVLAGTDEVGRTTMALSGDLAPGAGRGLLIDVGADMTSGQTYKVKVLLRKGSTTVDAYHKEVTVPQT